MTDPGLLAAQLLQRNWHKFGTFRTKCTFKEMGDATKNTATGVVTPVEVSSTPDRYFIFDEFNFTQTQAGVIKAGEAKIESIDKIAMIPSLDLPSVPKIADLIIDDEDVTWRVMAIGGDPKPAHYSLHVRPISG